MLTLCRSVFAGFFALAVLGHAAGARAATIDLVTTPFTGTDTAVRIAMTEDGGDILFTVTVEQGLADLRGVYLNLADDSLLDPDLLEVEGEFVTDRQFLSDGVIDLGQGSNLHGGGSPCPCDIGVELGTPGIGKDDILSTSFVLSHESVDLALFHFSEQLLGVRVTSVGPDPDSRGGSAKLGGQLGVIPVPEPSTAVLLALGLVALGGAGRRR